MTAHAVVGSLNFLRSFESKSISNESFIVSTNHHFPQTRWSLVQAANDSQDVSSKAISAICQSYWAPLYAFVRRSHHSQFDAEDLTQEFFKLLIEKRWLQSVDPAKGKLRTFLMTAMHKFLAKQARYDQAQKRGGGARVVSFDTDAAEERLAGDGERELTPQECYDQQWAMAVLELSISQVQSDYESGGKGREFEVLKPYLMAQKSEINYAVIAPKLSITEGAARVAVHRLRKRFRELYRAEIAETVADPDDIEAEIRYLANVLARNALFP